MKIDSDSYEMSLDYKFEANDIPSNIVMNGGGALVVLIVILLL